MGLLVGRSPQDESEVILAQTKNNVAREQVSLAFAVVPSARDGEVPIVEWRGESEWSAQDLVCPPAGEGASAPARAEAEEMLRELLASGTAAATDVYDEAERRGIRKATLRRAREALDVSCERIGGLAGKGRWYWSLPGSVAARGDGAIGEPALEAG